MKLTFEVLQSFSCSSYGLTLNAHQFRLIGIGWPPSKGWIDRVIGKEIPDETVMIVRQLRGMRKKARNWALTGDGINPAKLFQQPLKGL